MTREQILELLDGNRELMKTWRHCSDWRAVKRVALAIAAWASELAILDAENDDGN